MLTEFMFSTALVAMTLVLPADPARIFGGPAGGPEAPATVSLKGIPGELRWKNSPEAWKIEEDRLTIVAGRNTDWFISPLDGKVSASAPLLLFEPAADFILSARVRVDLTRQWAAGFLMVYVNDSTWAKLALELSAYKEPTVVTLVTRGISDDCNSAVVAGDSVYLQVAHSGKALFFYSSSDGHCWKLVRAFALGTGEALRIGFAAQSPVGDGATAVFSEIRYAARRILDVFAGQ